MGWKGVVRMDKGENAQYLQKAKKQASLWFLHTPRWAESHLKFSVLSRVATLQNSNSTKQTKLKWKKKKKKKDCLQQLNLSIEGKRLLILILAQWHSIFSCFHYTFQPIALKNKRDFEAPKLHRAQTGDEMKCINEWGA